MRRSDTNEELVMTLHKPPKTASRRPKLAAALLLACAVSMGAACGDDDDNGSGEGSGDDGSASEAPAVCTSLESLSTDIDALRDLDLEGGEGAVADLEASLESIQSDLDAVRTDAAAELSDPIDALQGSVDALSTEVESVKSAGDVTASAARGLLDDAAAVSTDWVVLTAAAPDCDLQR